jgi:hypothetical protein
MIVYDKTTDSIISQLDWGDTLWPSEGGNPIDFNWIGMSPSGTYVWGSGPGSNVYPRNLSSVRNIDTGSQHSVAAYDDEGNEVIFYAYQYSGDSNNWWMYMADFATGTVHPLAPTGNFSQHTSGNVRGKNGWGLVSTYIYTDTCDAPTLWYQNKVMMYEISRRITTPTANNHTKVWILAHTHTCRKGYNDDPFAKTNKAGTKIWFGTAWDVSYFDGNPYDVYQIDLPATWYQDLMGGNTPPAPARGLRIVSIP